GGCGAGGRRDVKAERVDACPPSLLYRLGKAARKNKVALTLAGTAAALLLVGAVLSGWQAIRAMSAERAALSERDETEKARQNAEREADAAKTARDQLRRTHYALAMHVISTAWQDNNVSRVVQLLEQQVPRQDEED